MIEIVRVMKADLGDPVSKKFGLVLKDLGLRDLDSRFALDYLRTYEITEEYEVAELLPQAVLRAALPLDVVDFGLFRESVPDGGHRVTCIRYVTEETWVREKNEWLAAHGS